MPTKANTVKTKVGDLVQVEGELDTFQVTGKERSITLLRNTRTKKTIRVHYSKVVRVVEEDSSDELPTMTSNFPGSTTRFMSVS